MGFADELRNMPDLQESRWQYQLVEEVRHLKGRCEAAARDGKRHLTGVEVRFRPLAYCDEYETIWMDGTAVQGYIGPPQQREAERARWSDSKSADTTATHSYTPYRPFTYSESRSEMEWNRDAVAHMLARKALRIAASLVKRGMRKFMKCREPHTCFGMIPVTVSIRKPERSTTACIMV